MQALEDPVTTSIFNTRHGRHILSLKCVAVAESGDLAPKPGQNIRREHGNSGAGCHASQRSLGARFSVGELVSADNDRNQTGDPRYRAGEQVLKSLEACVKRCPLRMSCQWCDEDNSEWREENMRSMSHSPQFRRPAQLHKTSRFKI
jgi:hypothetical protein